MPQFPGNIQGQAGQGSEQPHLAEDVRVMARGLDWLTLKCHFPPKLFHISIILEKKAKGKAAGIENQALPRLGLISSAPSVSFPSSCWVLITIK